MDLDVFRLFIYSVAASVVFCFYSFLENHNGGECDCSGRPLPHVLNSRFVSEKCQFCALLSHFLTAYYLVAVVDRCFKTRFHLISSILVILEEKN